MKCFFLVVSKCMYVLLQLIFDKCIDCCDYGAGPGYVVKLLPNSWYVDKRYYRLIIDV